MYDEAVPSNIRQPASGLEVPDHRNTTGRGAAGELRAGPALLARGQTPSPGYPERKKGGLRGAYCCYTVATIDWPGLVWKEKMEKRSVAKINLEEGRSPKKVQEFNNVPRGIPPNTCVPLHRLGRSTKLCKRFLHKLPGTTISLWAVPQAAEGVAVSTGGAYAPEELKGEGGEISGRKNKRKN